MDLDIAGVILEYLVRLPTLDGNVIKTLLEALPIRQDDHRLIKSILLRKLSLEISKGLVSEKTLETLERIEESDYNQGVNILESMSEAYCAVAVHCVVVHLKKIPIDFHSYFDAVVRIWRVRIHDLEKCEGVGLCSDKLKEMRCVIEEALWNESVRQRVLTLDTLGDAVRLVKVFLEDAMKQLGPSMLEIALRTMNDKGKEVFIPPSNLSSERLEERRYLADAPHRDIHVSEGNLQNDGNDVVLGSVLEINHAVNTNNNMHTPELEIVREAQKASTSDLQAALVENTLPRASKRKYNLSTPEVKTVQEALKSSLSDLQAVVKDPLPDALRMAKDISASMARESTTHQNTVLAGESGEALCAPSVDKGVTSAEADEGRNQSTTTRPSLMGRNSTARTYEWNEEDPIESSHERSPAHPHLPTPRRVVVSPLVNHNNKRLKRKWSPQEEQSLRDAVNKHGRGNWTFILNANRDVFGDRTAGDLKDKWRNMTR